MNICWICELPYSGEHCPDCGPPQPWGPTPEELAADSKRETDTTIADELSEYDR